MSAIEAVYEDGVLRPLDALDLSEGEHVAVIVIRQSERQANATQSTEARQPLVGEELAKLLNEIAALPYTPHPDGRRDISESHDEFLYPKSGKISSSADRR